MKHMNHAARLLLLAVLVCAMLTVTVSAAGTDLVQVALEKDSAGVNAKISTDGVVTDGVVTLEYDSDALTYDSVEVTDEYVAMFAVNVDQPGVVRVSWVAPGAYEANSEGAKLILVKFTGTPDSTAMAMTGTATDGDGKSTEVDTDATLGTPAPSEEVDKSKLEELVKTAEGLNSKDYTEASWGKMQEALTAAKTVLADPDATQTEVDAAAAALSSAINALVKAIPAEEKPGDTPSTGDGFHAELFITLMVCAAMAATALIVANKRRDMR